MDTKTAPRHDSAELTRFTRDIPFPAFLLSHGFAPQEGSKPPSHYEMLHPSGRLLHLNQRGGTWLYRNPANPEDKGTIINFLQKEGLTLGEVRIALRPELQSADLPQRQQQMDLQIGQANRRAAREELQRFVRDIPLPQVMEDQGWVLDRSESSRNAMKYRCGSEVLIVGQKEGRWVYFNPLDRQDNGTVVNFMIHHVEPNLGKARALLRSYSDGKGLWSPAISVASPGIAGEQEKEKTRQAREQWRELPPVSGKARDYLLSRGLEPHTLEVYGRAMRTETIHGHENIAFAHVRFDDVTEAFALSGWERKGPGRNGKSFSGFAGGKGIAVFAHQERDKQLPIQALHICEASIDALSKAQMDGLPRQHLYLSTGGGWGKETEKALLALLDRQRPQEVILALDNDLAGQQKTKEITELLTGWQEKNAGQITITEAVPKGKDWNEDLQAGRAPQESLEQACEPTHGTSLDR
ncbi:MAG: toprim domain-containing protein [Acidithiobacillus sp.]|nr:toprim domain-containing protein [Acidithiobacillus sp.]